MGKETPTFILSPTSVQDLVLTTPTRSLQEAENQGFSSKKIPDSTNNSNLLQELILSPFECALETAHDFSRDQVKEYLNSIPKGFTQEEANRYLKQKHRSKVTVDVICRKINIAIASKALEAYSFLGKAQEIATTYQEIKRLNPYSAMNDKPTHMLINVVGTVAETQAQVITSQWIGGAVTPMLVYLASAAGITIPPVPLTLAAMATGWYATRYMADPFKTYLREKVMVNLPTTPKKSEASPEQTKSSAAPPPSKTPSANPTTTQEPHKARTAPEVMQPTSASSEKASTAATTKSQESKTSHSTKKESSSTTSYTTSKKNTHETPEAQKPIPENVSIPTSSQSLDQLFPKHDPLTAQNNVSISGPPPHIDPEKFKSKPINLGAVEWKTEHGNVEYSVGINNPIGGIFFAAHHAKNAFNWLFASSRERASINLQSAITNLAQANEYSKEKCLKKVEEAAREYTEKNKSDPQLHLHGKVIEHAARSHQTENIITDNAQKMATEYYAHYLGLNNQALEHLNNGRLSQAETLANEVYAHIPEQPQVCIVRALVLRKQGDTDGYNHLISRAESLLGEIESRDPERTINGYVHASSHPYKKLQEQVILLQLDEMHRVLENTNEAERPAVIGRIINANFQLTQKDPNNMEYQRALASSYKHSNNPSAALKIEKKICDSAYCTPEDLATYSDSLISKQEYEQAENVLTRYLQQKKMMLQD